MLEELYLKGGFNKDFDVFVQELLDEAVNYLLHKNKQEINYKAFGYESDGRE